MEEIFEQVVQFLQILLVYLEEIGPEAVEATNVRQFLAGVQWLAILLTALAGVYAARRLGMDYFGMLVIAFVSCVGGGTTRDLLLGRFPIFWLKTPIYLVTIMLVSLFGVFIQASTKSGEGIVGAIAQPVERLVAEESRAFILIDALALGLWTYLGTTYALASNIPLVIAPVIGVITAIFGGVLRDVFFARIPQQFLPGSLYAGASVLGAIIFVILYSYGVNNQLSFFICIGITFFTRVISLKFNISSQFI